MDEEGEIVFCIWYIVFSIKKPTAHACAIGDWDEKEWRWRLMFFVSAWVVHLEREVKRPKP